jgi:hypothetical protein
VLIDTPDLLTPRDGLAQEMPQIEQSIPPARLALSVDYAQQIV